LTRLDLVKHSVKAVIAMMKATDQFGLVEFSSSSNVAMPMTFMDEAGRSSATTIVDRLFTRGTTNLWAGLRDALKLASQGARDNATNAIMLLTDGVPNTREGLDVVVADNTDCPSTVSTFGFGYSLDTALLVDIAESFHGMFTFIPDASFVGTAFVNNTASILATTAQACKLTLLPGSGVQIAKTFGKYPRKDLVAVPSSDGKVQGGGPAQKGVVLQIGPCMSGQARSACMLVTGVDTIGGEMPLLTAVFEATTTKQGTEEGARFKVTQELAVGEVLLVSLSLARSLALPLFGK
jgi:hypothetical protein